MKNTTDIFYGSPIEIPSEKAFFENLRKDLHNQGESALILCNFFTPGVLAQIDFFVVTSKRAVHVELKNLTLPIVGGVNGTWALKQPNGGMLQLNVKNPYRQTLDAKYAISDELKKLSGKDPKFTKPAPASQYYNHFESVICVYPNLLPGSSIPNDNRVRSMGYSDLLKLLTELPKPQLLTHEDWLHFVMHLGLTRGDDQDSGTAREILDARQTVNGYLTHFSEFNSHKLHELVSTPVRGPSGTIESKALLPLLAERRHVQLVGESGGGKTHHAKHLALHAAAKGIIPVILSAKHYDGRLSRSLDRSVAHLQPLPFASLHKASETLGSPLVLVVDEINRCPQQLRESLLQDLQAFSIRWSIPLLITTQETLQLPCSLKSDIFVFETLSQESKHAVLASYAEPDAARKGETVAAALHTPYELSLLAEVCNSIPADASRADIIDAYVQRRCQLTKDAHVARRILVDIADYLGSRFAATVPLGEIWLAIVPLLERDGIGLSALNEVMECGLVNTQEGHVAFCHEVIESFFRAEALLIKCQPEDLPIELSKPKNRDLAELLIGLLKDELRIGKCLESLCDVDILVAALKGALGTKAQRVIVAQAGTVLRIATQDASELVVELGPQDGFAQLNALNGRDWSQYERALMRAIGVTLHDGLFLPQVSSLIQSTEQRCRELIKPVPPKKGKSIPSKLVSSLYVLAFESTDNALPISSILRASQGGFHDKRHPSATEWALEVASNPNDRAWGELYLAILLLRWSGACSAEVLKRFALACWETTAYHLRLDVLQLVHGHAKALEANKAEICEFLGSLLEESNHVFLNTPIIDALNSFGGLPPQSTIEGVALELEQILANPADENARQLAYNAIGMQFEDVFSEGYYSAIQALPAERKALLYTMAVLGAASHGFHTDWAMAELVSLNTPTALPAFERSAKFVDPDAVSTQQATSCFILAHIGYAKLLDVPPQVERNGNDNWQAWQTYGEIVFWMSKPGTDKATRDLKCAPLWETLLKSIPCEALDPLLHFSHSYRVGLDKNTTQEFAQNWPNELRRLLEFGLRNRSRLTSLYLRMSKHYSNEYPAFIIRWLGLVGDAGTVQLLEPLVEDADLGRAAVEAIRAIKARA